MSHPSILRHNHRYLIMISIPGLEPRARRALNIIIQNIILFNKATQIIAGITEFVAGNAVCYPVTLMLPYTDQSSDD
ncbi:hypothetical protein F5Y06DRAFT_127468 [Hypoxylon sp. FL0890]|nr:hypothetical protein F5Y06DRAFT_127468 [Hypoxylon sp. FL0890]